MAGKWQWQDDNGWQDYSSVDSAALEASFQAKSAKQAVCNGGYSVTLSYSDKKQHVQQNNHTKFKRNVRRLDVGGVGKVKSVSKKKAEPEEEEVRGSGEEEEDGFVVVKGTSGKEAKGQKGSESSNMDGTVPYPEATEVSPVWDYVDPKSGEWVKFTGAYTKMVEGLSKRSGVFALNVPGAGGFQVTLANMMMKSNASGDGKEWAIRRTPPLRTTSASPNLMAISGATTSSASGMPSKKKKKGASMEENRQKAHMFEVEEELVTRCKKATAWKSIAKKDYEKLLKDSTCVICCDEFGDDRTVVKLSKCGTHYFHENCIAASFKPGFISCPVCQTIYGIRTGTQPKGTMKASTSSSEKLPGYEKFGTITIHYNFKDGIQEAHHPEPGQHYTGTSRTAYLPDSPEGRNVLKLLQLAFDRHLVFTIGTSVTTGSPNCVIWNGIHHKTCTSGGSTNFGYPDETYLARVTDELKAKGISLD